MLRKLLLTLVALLGLAGDLRGQDAVAIAWNDFDVGKGLLGAVNASAPWEVVRDPIPVGLDSVMHAAFGKLFVLSGGDRTVRVVDPVAWTVERSYVLPAGDDPLDIKVASPQVAYISRRSATQLLRLDLASGTVQESVNLRVFADGDGVPDQNTMTIHDGRLFIQLQRVNINDPNLSLRPAVAVIDLATEQLIDADPVRVGLQPIELSGTFPKMKMQVVPETRKLFVSATGAFFDAGGIEVIDLDSLRSEGLAIREADDFTGADLGAFVMVAPDRGFLAYSTDLLLSSHLHQFSLTEGVDPRELANALDYFSPAIEFHSATNSVFFPVGGRIENGLLAFDATTGRRLSEQLIATTGPPTDLVVFSAIPEPATLALAVAFIACLPFVSAARRRQRRKRQWRRLT